MEHQHLGEKIKNIREVKRISIPKLAKLTELSDNHLREIEKGERVNLKIDTLKRIASALNVPVISLINEENTTQGESVNINTEKIEGKIEELAEKIVKRAFGKVLKKNKNFDVQAMMEQLNISLPVVGKRVTLPLVRNIHCGSLKTITEVDEMTEVPPGWGDKGDFCIQVTGDSMKEHGIVDGMTVLIKYQEICDNGDIVLIYHMENENCRGVLKKARYIKENVLIFQNGNGDNFLVDENIKIIGKVIACAKMF